MDLSAYFGQCKIRIGQALETELVRQRPGLAKVNVWGEDMIDRLSAFVSQGKMLRGGLVCLSAEMFGRPVDEQVLSAAAAMELFQAGLLVHDDIMDGDQLRRGQPALWKQYQRPAMRAQPAALVNQGVSLAMCAGDASFFMAMGMAARSGRPEIAQAMGQELTRVCVAQMADVAWADDGKVPTEAEILAMYQSKTAGYSIVLPLTVGALLAGQSGEVVEQLAELGTRLGLIFQIKDDELGIWGDPKDTGKPVGADISEGKKTLYYRWLIDRADPADTSRINQLFGCHRPIDTKELNWVRQRLVDLGIKAEMGARMAELATQASHILTQLTIDDTYRLIMTQFISYCRQRQA